jgi:hypothetical protein
MLTLFLFGLDLVFVEFNEISKLPRDIGFLTLFLRWDTSEARGATLTEFSSYSSLSEDCLISLKLRVIELV